MDMALPGFGKLPRGPAPGQDDKAILAQREGAVVFVARNGIEALSRLDRERGFWLSPRLR
jgi:hypothetical protein